MPFESKKLQDHCKSLENKLLKNMQVMVFDSNCTVLKEIKGMLQIIISETKPFPQYSRCFSTILSIVEIVENKVAEMQELITAEDIEKLEKQTDESFFTADEISLLILNALSAQPLFITVVITVLKVMESALPASTANLYIAVIQDEIRTMVKWIENNKSTVKAYSVEHNGEFYILFCQSEAYKKQLVELFATADYVVDIKEAIAQDNFIKLAEKKWK